MNKTWRLLLHPDLPGARQMAIDEALYRSATSESSPVLRFYTWLRPTLSLGYFQRYKSIVSGTFCVDNSIDIVRRITGGRAVLHQYEMTYSIVAPLEDQFKNPSLHHTYQLISAALHMGLSDLGYVQASIATFNGNQNRHLPQCFVSVSKYEIANGFRKVIGSAQKRSKDRFLQHGSILLNFDERMQNGCILHPDPNIVQKIAPLEASIGRPLSFDELQSHFTSSFERSFRIRAERSELNAAEMDLAEELEEKYSSKEWTQNPWK